MIVIDAGRLTGESWRIQLGWLGQGEYSVEDIPHEITTSLAV